MLGGCLDGWMGGWVHACVCVLVGACMVACARACAGSFLLLRSPSPLLLSPSSAPFLSPSFPLSLLDPPHTSSPSSPCPLPGKKKMRLPAFSSALPTGFSKCCQHFPQERESERERLYGKQCPQRGILRCCQQSDRYTPKTHRPHVGKGAAGEQHRKCRHAH